MYGTGLSHAGTAATALMGEALLETDKSKLERVVSGLTSLRQSIRLMSPTYPPGAVIANVVDGYLSTIDVQGNDGPDGDIGNRNVPVGSPHATAVQGNTYTEDVDTNMANMRDDDQGVVVEHLRRKGRNVNPYSFTPTEAASHSVNGLPFLPSSFLEGLNADDLVFAADQMGHSDYGFSWDADGEEQGAQ